MHTLKSYAKQRGISQKKAKEALEKLVSGRRAQKVTLSETEVLYARNKKIIMKYIVTKNPGADCKRLAKLTGTKEQYAGRLLRELVDEGEIYFKETPARRWLGPYKYYPSQAK